MSRTLIGTITERASSSFPQKVTGENFKEWHSHWLYVAGKFHQELMSEGLLETASAVQGHIDFETKWAPK